MSTIKGSGILEKVVEIKLRLEIGVGWLYWPRQFALIVVGILWILNYFNIVFEFGDIVIFSLLGIIAVYIIGKLDLDYFKVYEKQQGLQAGRYNYFFRQKLGKV